MDDTHEKVDEFLYCHYCAVRIRNPRKSTCPQCFRELDKARGSHKNAPVLFQTTQIQLAIDQLSLDRFLR